MADVRPENNESFESMLKRFNRKVQQDGILSEARRRTRFERPPTRRKRKDAAKRRLAIKAARKAT
ncbi:MAG: 30S ribosomal protein S21 [Dehalococcoides mccartyi]|jgi:small subunit ribosomal protein S21|uniref:Small ribosomal subunit protein bS21 n=6 Tax=root TaxID=1 RepID=RS21_DEHM1|nr:MULTISPECIES: 30S ribosomal protein S21 [Dehalococcoides]A5FSB3.1 RecName: Full=Small ribosomal subunit protein bS21; AltName: Full=30S ribosomal protein S21 [Dehalococcoides mccartyi BAV1]Q3Z9K2.1 RecName: Full=Small ribosomal subunit protein bS21; AltName: Full=30S ribosomal protein S21 [Dehalococcoides mccartyi 195]Q3ZZ95.1 RecName: Full=Small ribosomal subunit protein bS21; AltName: Full=30S ribosomal protein S21 [Dehalococcoides mccartyi CBDB1]AAW40395.1 ribosomal protein S21 [Dehalococ